DAIDPQILGNLAEFRSVVATLGKFKRWNEGAERSLRFRPFARHAFEFRLFAQDKIHFRAWAGHLDSFHRAPEFCRQFVWLDEMQERPLRIGIRENKTRLNLGAV